GIERHGDVPDPVRLEGRPRPTVEDAIFVAATEGREPCLEVLPGALAGEHGYRIGPRMVVERLAHPERVPVARQVEMHDLSERMHAGIGAPCGLRYHALATEALDRLF